MKRRQTWECVPCRRTTYVDHHGSDPLPTERQCQCKRPMGLVLFSEDEPEYSHDSDCAARDLFADVGDEDAEIEAI